MSQDTKAPRISKKLLILVLAAAIGLGILLYVKRGELAETVEVLKSANPWLIFLLPVIQTINYFMIGLYYRSMFRFFGTKINYRRAWGVVAAMNFVNQVLPSGGVSGITYLAYGFRTRLRAGKVTLIQLGRYVAAFSAYLTLAPVALLLLLYNDRLAQVNSIAERASHNTAAIITASVFLVLVISIVVLFANQRISGWIGNKISLFLNAVGDFALRKKHQWKFEAIRHLHDEFIEGVHLMRQLRLKALRPFSAMLVSAVCELGIVYVSLLAVGATPPFAVVFVAFMAANIVGTVSVIPGDVGVHEAVMIIMLSAFGVDEATAISATLLYRVFNKMIFLPVGFYFYTNILKPAVEER